MVRCSLSLLLMLVAVAPVIAADDESALDRARGHHREGQLEEALTWYDEVISSGESADRATAFNNACVIYNGLGRHAEALESCEAALAIRREIDDELRLGRTLNNLGLTQQYLGDYSEAETLFREALEINRTLGDPNGEAINLANIGLVATQAGRYREALVAYRDVERLAEEQPDAWWAADRSRYARLNTGVVYERLGAHRSALDQYQAILETDDELPAEFRGLLLSNLGVVYRNLGDPVTAVEMLGRSVIDFEAVGDRGGEANAWLNLGLARHLGLSQLEAGEDAYREALRLASEAGDQTEVVRARVSIARLLEELDRNEEAADQLRRALAAAESSGFVEGRWSALAGLGRLALGADRPRDALGHLEPALDAIESVRADLERDALRAGFFGDWRSVYATAVEAWARLASAGDPEAARHGYGVVQRAKARDLLDALGREPWVASAEIPTVGADELVVEYFVGDRVWAWSIRNGDLEMADLGPAVPIIDRAIGLHADLGAGRSPASDRLTELSQELLGWLDVPWSALTEVRFAPDGPLALVPFELLPVDGSPLIGLGDVAYLPSASAVAPARSRRELTWDLAGIGAPITDSDHRTANPATDVFLATLALPPLPGAERELRLIGSGFPPGRRHIAIGSDATEAAFRRLGAEGSRVLHFAAHAVAVPDRQGGSAIVLTAEQSDDGLLRPAEIASTELATDLTVLSACRTATDTPSGPGALASLVGSFLAAGSAGVVATLWEVDDAATAVFMERFYAGLSRGERPAKALAEVKHAMLADPHWSDPDVWAAFVLVGDPPPVAEPPIWRRLGAPLVGLLLAVAIAVAIRRRHA